MRGHHRVALHYADKTSEVAKNVDVRSRFRAEEDIPFIRLERAVILRLLGEHDEGLKEFEELLALEPDFMRVSSSTNAP